MEVDIKFEATIGSRQQIRSHNWKSQDAKKNSIVGFSPKIVSVVRTHKDTMTAVTNASDSERFTASYSDREEDALSLHSVSHQHDQCFGRDVKEDKFSRNNVNRVSKRSLQVRSTREYVIAQFTLKYFKGEVEASSAPDKACDTMIRVSEKLLVQHEMFYSQLVTNILQNGHATQSHAVISQVAESVFGDDKINWGRIAALYSFAAKMAKYCKAKQLDTDLLVESLADYTSTQLGDWILKNGGWVITFLLYKCACMYFASSSS